MFRAPTAGQQILKDFNAAVPEEAKIVVIIKTVLDPMKNNFH
jgi:hypothetical protein